MKFKVEKKEVSIIPLEFIDYTSSDCNRNFVVNNGRSYYRSSGENSGIPGTWLACIMCRGNACLKKEQSFLYDYQVDQKVYINTPTHLKENSLEDLFNVYVPSGYIVKANKDFLKDEYINLTSDQINKIDKLIYEYIKKNNAEVKMSNIQGRFLTKNHLLDSIRLGGGLWEDITTREKIVKSTNNCK